MKDITEAFAVLKAIAERERPEIVSFGDSETMHATGIVGWLRGDGRWKLLDGFDPAMSYPWTGRWPGCSVHSASG